MQQWYQCPRCGAPVAFGARFCVNCGTQLNWPTQQPPPLYQQQAQTPQYQQQYQQPGGGYQQQPEPQKKKSNLSQNKQQMKTTAISGKHSRIAKLPQISDAFTNHINSHVLLKNEWVPCPQCGQGTVDRPSGKAIGCLAGSALIVWWIMLFTIVAIIAGIFFWPLAIGIIIGGIIGIFLLPLIGTALGLVYRCKSCNYSWKFEDIENYKNTI